MVCWYNNYASKRRAAMFVVVVVVVFFVFVFVFKYPIIVI